MKAAGVPYNGTVAWGEWASQDRTVAQLEKLSSQARAAAGCCILLHAVSQRFEGGSNSTPRLQSLTSLHTLARLSGT